MKTLFIAGIILILGGAFYAYSAEAKAPAASQSMINGISVSPYYTVGFAQFDEKATGGAGLDIGLNLSKSVQLVSFAESDDAQGSFVDRFGLGVQLTGKLGKWLKPFGRLSGGYTFESSAGLEERLFIRPQFGAVIDIWRKGDWHASLTGSWGLDVDTSGNAAQRIFGGLVVGTSF